VAKKHGKSRGLEEKVMLGNPVCRCFEDFMKRRGRRRALSKCGIFKRLDKEEEKIVNSQHNKTYSRQKEENKINIKNCRIIGANRLMGNKWVLSPIERGGEK